MRRRIASVLYWLADRIAPHHAIVAWADAEKTAEQLEREGVYVFIDGEPVGDHLAALRRRRSA